MSSGDSRFVITARCPRGHIVELFVNAHGGLLGTPVQCNTCIALLNQPLTKREGRRALRQLRKRLRDL